MAQVGFAGRRAVSAPLTWGQRAIWKAIESVTPNDHWLNVRRILRVPAKRALDLPGALEALSRLVSRHEGLRTRIRSGPNGLVQQVADAGRVPVEVVEVADAPDPAATAGEVLARLASRPFRYADELPLRVALLTGAGRVHRIVLVASHVALDWYAAELLVREMRLLLARGSAPVHSGLSPVDLARRERESGRRTERALAHWLTAYRRMPEELFAVDGAAPRFREVCLTSRALGPAAAVVAARHGVSTSCVLLAATAALAGRFTGHPTCGLLTVVHNRFQPGHEHIVAPMNQLALVVLDVGGAPALDDLVPEAWRAALTAYRHAYYDQDALDRALAGAGRGGGLHVDPYFLFNDVRSATDAGPSTAPEWPVDSEVVASDMDTLNWRCYVEVRDAPGGLALAVQADTRALPPDRIEAFARQLELTVVESAMKGEPR